MRDKGRRREKARKSEREKEEGGREMFCYLNDVKSACQSSIYISGSSLNIIKCLTY